MGGGEVGSSVMDDSLGNILDRWMRNEKMSVLGKKTQKKNSLMVDDHIWMGRYLPGYLPVRCFVFFFFFCGGKKITMAP